MRDYGKISTTIWHSRKFRGLKDADAQLLYLYLLTCPHVNSAGCFVLRDGYAVDDLAWDFDRYHRAMEALSKALLVSYDKGEKVVRIHNFFTFEPLSNGNHAKGTAKIALHLPDCHNKLLVLQEIQRQDHGKNIPDVERAIKALSEGYRTPEPEPEPEPIPDPEPDSTALAKSEAPDPKPKTKRGTRIAPDWVPNENDRQFALNEGLSHDTIDRIAAEFRDYWISVAGAKGTKLDWSATWRNRVRSIQDRGGQGSRAPGPRSPHQTLFDGAAASAAKHERGEGYG